MPGGGGSGSTTTVNKTEYPPEYNALMSAASNKAQAIAGDASNYAPYPGQTVAGLSPDQLAAMNLSRQSIGMNDNIFAQQEDLLNEYGSYDPLGTGTQLLDQYGRPDLYSGMGTASPYMAAASPYLDASTANYTQSLMQQYGTDKRFTDYADDYMSPYTSGVVDEIARLGTRNLTENLLPGVNKTFVGGGTFGGSRSADFTNRAVRDANESIMGQQAMALERGYDTAGNLFNQDQSRLQGAVSNLGSLASGDVNRAASGYMDMGNQLAALGAQDAARSTDSAKYLEELGQRGATNQANLANLLGQYGQDVYNQNVKDISMLQGIGATQQGQEQAEIDAAIQKYAQEKGIPMAQLETLIKPLQSINLPTTQTSTSTQSGGGGNMFGQVLGGLLGAAGTAGSLGWKPFRRGGPIDVRYDA